MSLHFGVPSASPAVWHPKDVKEAVQLKLAFGPEGVYVSGGTLLRTQWESGLRRMPSHLINLGTLCECSCCGYADGQFVIGSQTTLASCCCDAAVRADFPLLAEALRHIAAPSVRNLATIGGNVVSRIGDSIPALLICDAELVWSEGVSADGLQIETLSDWLACSSGIQTDPNRLLMQIRLPMAATEIGFAYYDKVGRREAFTPSVVTAAIAGSIDGEGCFRDMKLAAGGGQTVPRRFPELEEWLEGSVGDEDTISELYERLMEQFDPVPDAFATADYRRRTAAHFITAHLWQVVTGKS
jgi:carbon-monoxide dehydrogenase medium subunit